MQKTLNEIAKLIDGQVIGNGDTLITGASGIREAAEGEITFLANSKYSPLMDKTHAAAIITSADAQGTAKPIIITQNPSLAFVKIISMFTPDDAGHPRGIDYTVVMGKNVSLGKDVTIGAYSVIGDNVTLGDNVIIYAGCYIGHHTKIGNQALIYPHVSIRERIRIGSGVIIHSGAVIGSDGFGFVTVKGAHHKIPQVGTVEIGDNVEIGANVTIDRARFGKTVIGRGTKIDNLVQIGHNVAIGENTLIVAQVGIAGSVIIGKNVTLGGQAGLVGHIIVGDNAIVTGQTGVAKSVPPDTMVSGYPARPFMTTQRVNASLQNLPKLFNQVKELKIRIQELEARAKDK
ncbi:MAG: UDP-3-O-(3-hydroxymyristoyl)glucosamine N-acyltransferase [Candidatus Omnitrophica bacterium]|nr:UDP-3-O-(3-hydroxymyristoyl)glucosamine N-acyltransferase [Candidatus Omnitrophota bacterium]MBU4303005.1 UDP-3-O-(3-hydroxymyristoyl)glucosamine N-acyltransferase [Candidatus Omnitrophota bacterium]MBU4468517.1 UDP-3-O-(3-hydroxymyristoyl)glucosamine N-acyltransferase [Candidatus Omnitrophota bacterium]MCG2707979.1 UDP-3-O-(3-hydroxymyristoyl)glucosamine N-acyltransferase [Candidatus Omnitrophota bacterium]